MNIPRFALRRPVATLMSIFIILLLGTISLLSLPLEFLPKMEFPVAAVAVNVRGAGPQEVETLVTRPLEEALATVNNVKNVRSESREGASAIMVELNWGTDLDQATLQMRERIDMVREMLPDEADRPLVLKFDPSLMPIMILSVSGNEDAATMRRLAKDVIEPQLERLDGVASVTVQGGMEREIAIEADPQRLQSYGISLDTIAQALRARNVTLPGGSVSEGRGDLLLRTMGEFRSVEEIRDMPFATPRGSLIRIRDVAEVRDGYKDPTTLTRLNNKPSVSVSVQKETNANAVKVSRKVRAELAKIQKEMPAGLQVGVFFDQAQFVRRSVADVARSATEGGVLAVVLILLFLRNVRSTLVVALAIPISLMAAFALIYFTGMSLNMITLGGLALGIGRLVDDAIVVLESIYRHREEGRPGEVAAETGAHEVLGAITGVTLTTVAVFLPIVFVEGLAGQIFREMALAITYALLASLFIAMTVIPLVAARLLKGGPGREGQVVNVSDGRVQRFYGRAITWALGHRWAVVLVAVLAFVGSVAMLPRIGAQFMPKVDEGQFAVSVELPKGSSLEDTNRIVSRVETIIMAQPEMEQVFVYVGSQGANTGGVSDTFKHQGRVEGRLVEKARRQRGTEQVMDTVRKEVNQIPGARFITAASGGLGGGRGGGNSPISISIRGEDINTLRTLADEVSQRVRAVPGSRDVTTSLTDGRPEVRVVLNQEKAASLGLSVSQVGQALRSAVEGQVVTRYRAAEDQVDIAVRAQDRVRQDRYSLEQVPIALPTGGTALLGEVARVEEGRGPISISRDGQVRVVTVEGDVAGRPLGSVIADIQKKIADFPMPAGYTLEFGGEQKDMAESFASLGKAVLAAILLVYMILAAQFESLLQPITIMVSVPLGLIGAVLGLLLTGRLLDITAFIGFIMLTGIAVSNAILLVDYILILRRRGQPRNEAIRQAGMVRLRPVLMTALATILGLIPLASGVGEGAEFQATMATVALFGLLVSTVLTLLVLPVIYSLLDDVGRFFSRRLRVAPGADPTKDQGGDLFHGNGDGSGGTPAGPWHDEPAIR